MNIDNVSKRNSGILNDIVNIITVHTGICSDITVRYIDNIASAEKGVVNVIMDDSDERHIEYFDRYFLINPHNISENGFSEENGIFVLDFDILKMMETILFDNLDFIEDHMFKYAFAERLIMIFYNCAKAMAIYNNMHFRTVSGSIKGYNGYFVPTFDVDRMNYINTAKTLLYSIYSIFGMKKGKTAQYKRIKQKAVNDPWNNINKINDILFKEGLTGLFNFLTVKRDKYARRYSLKTAREAAKRLDRHRIGVHLTYRSRGGKAHIEREIKRARTISNNIKISRFHYLHDPTRCEFGILDQMGIILDSSSGFRKRLGFKRGMSKPYRVPGTSITELPVICMDSAYMSSEGSELIEIIEEIKLTEGFFTFIFHQSALDEDTFPGYRAFFNTMLSIRDTAQLYSGDILDMTERFNKRVIEKMDSYEYND